MASFHYSKFDSEFWAKELESFVPREVYDMHTHLWTEHGQEHLPPPDSALRTEIDFAALNRWSREVYPNRECHYLALGSPVKGLNLENHNRWLSMQIGQDSKSAFGMIVTPDMNAEELQRQITTYGFKFVKPYLAFAPNPGNASIQSFLPEHLMEVIDEYGLGVTLHLSYPTGADAPENLRDLKLYTQKYPNIKWVLAHCARAFNSCLLERSIHTLRELPRIWYDTSAVNDLYSHYLLLKHESINRIMFGSDSVCGGGVHGKYITYAHAWRYYPGTEVLAHCNHLPTLIVYEQLLQQRRVIEMLNMNESDIIKIFSGNAKKLIEEINPAGKSRSILHDHQNPKITEADNIFISESNKMNFKNKKNAGTAK